MIRNLLVALASATLAACSQPSNDTHQTSTTPITPTTTTSPTSVTLPTVASSMSHQLLSGKVTLTSESGPGTATVTAAGLAVNTIDPAFGTGSFSVAVNGTTYASSVPSSAFGTATDDSSGTTYVIVSLFVQTDASDADELDIVVPQSDFAPGATITLDGETHYALFYTGDPTQQAPSFAALATSGSVTFASTASLTGTIDATLNGTFTQVDLSADAPDGGTTRSGAPDGGAPDSGTDGGAPSLPAAGTYAAALQGPAEARCAGSLEGKEADFAAIVPTTIFDGSAIAISIAGGAPTASSSGFLASFALTDLPMSAADGAPVWFYDRGSSSGTAGPDGSVQTDIAFSLQTDPSASLYGDISVLYTLASDQSSLCQVDFLYSLTSS